VRHGLVLHRTAARGAALALIAGTLLASGCEKKDKAARLAEAEQQIVNKIEKLQLRQQQITNKLAELDRRLAHVREQRAHLRDRWSEPTPTP
jgi:hypothetical protein